MLGVLLLVLKIIFIVLAVLLGLVLLILLAVLFIPVRYSAKVQYYEGKPEADVRVTALLRLIRFRLTYVQELSYKVKVLFFTMYSSDKEKVKAALEAESESTYTGKGSKTSKKDSKKERNVFDEADETETEKEREADNSLTKKVSDGNNNKIKDNNQENNRSKDDKQALIEQEREAQATRNIFIKLLYKIKSLINNIKEKIILFKNKLVSMIDSVKTKKEDLSSKVNRLYDIINDQDNRDFVRFLWEQLKKLIKAIKPAKGHLYVHFGMDDPETTGKLAMYLAVLYGWLGLDIRLLPDFEQKIIEGELDFKGSIRVFSLLVIAVRIYKNKMFKKLVLNK